MLSTHSSAILTHWWTELCIENKHIAIPYVIPTLPERSYELKVAIFEFLYIYNGTFCALFIRNNKRKAIASFTMCVSPNPFYLKYMTHFNISWTFRFFSFVAFCHWMCVRFWLSVPLARRIQSVPFGFIRTRAIRWKILRIVFIAGRRRSRMALLAINRFRFRRLY